MKKRLHHSSLASSPCQVATESSGSLLQLRVVGCLCFVGLLVLVLGINFALSLVRVSSWDLKPPFLHLLQLWFTTFVHNVSPTLIWLMWMSWAPYCVCCHSILRFGPDAPLDVRLASKSPPVSSFQVTGSDSMSPKLADASTSSLPVLGSYSTHLCVLLYHLLYLWTLLLLTLRRTNLQSLLIQQVLVSMLLNVISLAWNNVRVWFWWVYRGYLGAFASCS